MAAARARQPAVLLGLVLASSVPSRVDLAVLAGRRDHTVPVAEVVLHRDGILAPATRLISGG